MPGANANGPLWCDQHGPYELPGCKPCQAEYAARMKPLEQRVGELVTKIKAKEGEAPMAGEERMTEEELRSERRNAEARARLGAPETLQVHLLLDAARERILTLRGASNMAEVYTKLSEAAGPDTGPPTLEMAGEVWELMRDPDDSMLTLAVRAWERGRGFKEQKSRALAAESLVAELAAALRELVALKDRAETVGKDANYYARKGPAWEAARSALEKVGKGGGK